MSQAKKPPSLLHALAALAIVILSALLGLKADKAKTNAADNYQQIYLPPATDGTTLQDWPEIIFSQRIDAVYPARVIRIVDGDTIELLLADNSHPNVRLASIDAPERGQPFGAQATDVLKPYISQLVTVLQTKIDRWGRPIAFIVDEPGLNVNAAMIQAGYAWHYSQYSTDPVLSELQQQAQAQRVGLWQGPQPIAPDQWRRLSQRNSQNTK
jgi:endonuclease YncB( thermonuclease family)